MFCFWYAAVFLDYTRHDVFSSPVAKQQLLQHHSTWSKGRHTLCRSKRDLCKADAKCWRNKRRMGVLYIQLCIDVVHKSHKTVRKSIGNVRRVQMKNFVCQYMLPCNWWFWLPLPPMVFVYLVSFIFACLLSKFGYLWAEGLFDTNVSCAFGDSS